MSTNLLILVAIAVVLAAQAATVLTVRYLVHKWCTDVFKSGFRGGRQSAIESSEPFKEAYRLGYDVGHERGIQDALTDPMLDELSLEELEHLTTRLFQATSHRYDALNRDGAECEADR